MNGRRKGRMRGEWKLNDCLASTQTKERRESVAITISDMLRWMSPLFAIRLGKPGESELSASASHVRNGMSESTDCSVEPSVRA